METDSSPKAKPRKDLLQNANNTMKITALFFSVALGFIATTFAQPNYVFILVDDMGWTGTSVRMDPDIPDSQSDFYQTPNIEKLAEQGITFSQAYAPAALCTPSRAGILTGKTPAELHMTTPGGGRAQSYQKLVGPAHLKNLPSGETTIAEILKSNGYATAHFGKWHLGGNGPGHHGFDSHDGNTGNDPANNDPNNNPKDIYGINERAIEFITEESKTDSPFYVQLSHYAVHTPTEASDSSKTVFQSKKSGKQHTDRDYAAMTYDLDKSVGKLLSAIDHLGIADNTYVIFMSDNGASGNPRKPSNSPLNGGKGSLYEGGIRIPLIIRGPGILEGIQSKQAVTGYDLLPTICELSGLHSVEGLAGASIASVFAAPSKPIARTSNPFLFHYPHYGKGPRQKPQSALILGDFKILKDLESSTLQLFDLKNDPFEQKDLSNKMPTKTKELENELQAQLDAVDAQFPTKNRDYDPQAQVTRRRPQ